MQLAQQQIHAGNLGGANETLDEVKAKNPNEENLWNMYGLLAEMMDRNYQQAADDFRKELAAHPDNKTAVAALADAQTKGHDPEGARNTLQQYLDRHPDDAQLAIYLANLETLADNKEDALKTLEAATKQNPDNIVLPLADEPGAGCTRPHA